MGDGRIVIVGCDALAVAVCKELAVSAARPVTILWDEADDLAGRVMKCGGSFVARSGDERESLLAAGILDASVIVAITDNDHVNLQFALQARDANPGIRIVLRQFNRRLGRKIEENLDNSAAISLSSHAAATYAAAAMDSSCYFVIQFPDIDCPLAGFFTRSAASAGLAGVAARDVLARSGQVLLCVGDDVRFDRERVLQNEDLLTTFGPVLARRAAVAPARPRLRERAASALRILRRLDPVARRAMLVALVSFTLGSLFFARALHLDTLTAAYFALTTMTTTGYGDISPRAAGPAGIIVAMCLMLGGIVFSGIFIAMLSAGFTQARYDAVQGLRRITHGGHVIVCGAGNVGSRVLEFLVRLGCRVVVVEQSPRPEIIEGSRERRYELLTGDAARDETLDLCNVQEAVALIALTNSDTMNLEVALGARARATDPAMPVVLRVQHETFERSVRAHFKFGLTYGTAALGAPAIAGLALSAGARGYVGIGGQAYEIVESSGGDAAPGSIALAAWRTGTLRLLERLEDASPGENVLRLVPLLRTERSVRSSNEHVI
jgi:Trk K+ transport system NAD-binding subunit